MCQSVAASFRRSTYFLPRLPVAHNRPGADTAWAHVISPPHAGGLIIAGSPENRGCSAPSVDTQSHHCCSAFWVPFNRDKWTLHYLFSPPAAPLKKPVPWQTAGALISFQASHRHNGGVGSELIQQQRQQQCIQPPQSLLQALLLKSKKPPLLPPTPPVAMLGNLCVKRASVFLTLPPPSPSHR